MENSECYQVLRSLASPVVAITTRDGERTNGMIANSAIRASLSPKTPRIAFYCLKPNYSHNLLLSSGRFCLHLLHRGQFNVIRQLGFDSGSAVDKLDTLETRCIEDGMPVLNEYYAYFHCEVVNTMDAGASTFILGTVSEFDQITNSDNYELMDSQFFRKNMPADIRSKYEANKTDMQEWIENNNEINSHS